VSRSLLDRKVRSIKNADQCSASTPETGTAGSPSASRLVARSPTRSCGGRAESELQQHGHRAQDGSLRPRLPGFLAKRPDDRNDDGYIHNNAVTADTPCHIEIYPDSPALCPIASDRMARDLHTEDFAKLLRPARSVAQAFESPLPDLLRPSSSAQSGASPTDRLDFRSPQKATDQSTGDLFRDSASENMVGPMPETEVNHQQIRVPRIVHSTVSHPEHSATDARRAPALPGSHRKSVTRQAREAPELTHANTRAAHRIQLAESTADAGQHITVFEYGRAGVGTKAYLHAGLRTDDINSVVVLRQLMRRLDHADRNGDISGHCVIVPSANPAGASQYIQDQIPERHDPGSGEAIHCHDPQLVDSVAELAVQHLRGDSHYDKLIVRGALRAALARVKPLAPLDHLRHTLLNLACDADLVLDLRCEQHSVPHIYLGASLWPQANDLHRQMQSRATLLTEKSIDRPFDKAIAGVWWDLADRLRRQHELEAPCLAATLELNAARALSEQQAAHDADNLFRFLQRRGVVDGDAGDLAVSRCNPTPLEGVALIRADRSGVVRFLCEPGEFVRENDKIAVINDSDVIATTSGTLLSRTKERDCRPDQVLCRIASPTRIV